MGIEDLNQQLIDAFNVNKLSNKKGPEFIFDVINKLIEYEDYEILSKVIRMVIKACDNGAELYGKSNEYLELKNSLRNMQKDAINIIAMTDQIRSYENA